VQGLLYEVDDDDIRSLDRFEGTPRAYIRRNQTVIDNDGRRINAYVYARPEGKFEAGTPSQEYFDIIWQEYQSRKFDTGPLECVEGVKLREKAHRVFVYGTLLTGMSNHELLSGAKRIAKQARTEREFDMYDLGSFPGLVRGGINAVVGEVYEVDSDTLESMDRLEGHPHFYHRTNIVLADGAHVETYLLRLEDVEGHPVVASGSWAQRERLLRQ